MSDTSPERSAQSGVAPGDRANSRWRGRALAVLALALAGLVGLGWLERGSVRHSFTVLGHAKFEVDSVGDLRGKRFHGDLGPFAAATADSRGRSALHQFDVGDYLRQ